MAQVPQALSTEVPTREQIQQVRTFVHALLPVQQLQRCCCCSLLDSILLISLL